MQSAIEMTKPRSTAVTSKLCQTKRLKGLQLAFVIGYSTPRKDGLQKPHKWHRFLQIGRPGHQSNEGPPLCVAWTEVCQHRRKSLVGPVKTKGPICNTSQFPWKKWCMRPLHMHPSKMSILFWELDSTWIKPESLIKPKDKTKSSSDNLHWVTRTWCFFTAAKLSDWWLTIQNFSQPVDMEKKTVSQIGFP